MKRVIIESPYGGTEEEVKKNVEYARRCLLDSLKRGEAPIASHLLHTQVLDDNKPEERDIGIKAGLAWVDLADASVFYIDLGMSKGMKAAFDFATENGKEIIMRRLYY